MKALKIILILALVCGFGFAQETEKQAREEAGKALKEKRIDAKAFADLLGKINSGKAEQVLKELQDKSAASQAPLYSDWPQWLGPNRNASSPEKGMLRKWGENGPKLLWMVNSGIGWGSPSIAGKNLYIETGGGKARSVSCLDASTGSMRWKSDYTIAKSVDVGWGWCNRGTISVEGESLFNLDEQGNLICMSTTDGRIIWRRDLDEEFKPTHSDWKGWSWSPLVKDGVLVAPIPDASKEGVFLGLDAKTGKTIWTFREKPGQAHGANGADLFQTPQLITLNGVNCAMIVVNGRLVAFSLRDGKRVAGIEVTKRWMITTPQIVNGKVLVMPTSNSKDGASSLVELNGDRTKVLWNSTDIRGYYSPWVVFGEYLYGLKPLDDFGGGPYALCCGKISDGKTVWEEKSGHEKKAVGRSLILADGLLFIRSNTELVLAEANPEKYIELSRCNLGGGEGNDKYYGWVMPSLARGRLYVRNHDKLRCFQVAETLSN